MRSHNGTAIGTRAHGGFGKFEIGPSAVAAGLTGSSFGYRHVEVI